MSADDAQLKRSLGLPLLVLYGLGVTVGAGIYVLVGAAAGRAGMLAPFAFLVAPIVMGFTALTFCELAARFPVSAGEAAYVREGFRSPSLSFLTGALVIAASVVSSAAIVLGCAGYLRELVPVADVVLVPAIVLGVGIVAAWGIAESVMLAAVLTLVEVGGLVAIIAAGVAGTPDLGARLPELLPAFGDAAAWSGIASAGLIAFFAFIGFEDLVNVAEEARDPVRDMPRAIIATLVLTTVIYVLVVSVAVIAVPPAELAASAAPLADVFRAVTGAPSTAIAVIAVFATLNTIIVQLIMVSRVMYGMARLGSLPAFLGRVNPRTRTPLNATAIAVAAILIFALFLPLEGLAVWTSRVVLVIFTLVNLALARIKLARDAGPSPGFSVPLPVPVLGAVTCLGFLASDFLGS